MIKIICIGKLKENFLQEAQAEYLKRLSKYTKIDIIELVDDNLIKEKERILNNIKPKDNLILLDIKGEMKTSEEFAKLINNELSLKSNITFIIGSSNGVDQEIKKLCNKKISMSYLTFPHQFFRVMLLEQIYRSFKIINNETYHK